MRLFKYLSPFRLDVLENKMIAFSKPDRFNDPFDCNPHYTESNDLNPAGTSVLFVPTGLVVEPENHGAFASGFRASFARRMHDSMVALSLSEEPSSLLMWAHYAKDHAGFVIGFNSEHTYFDSVGEEPFNLGCLKKVVYSDERPSGVVLSMGVEKTHLTKSLEWSYEKEWRVLQVVDNASYVKVEPSGNIHLFAYPSEAVTQVIIGARATHQTKEDIKSILSDKNVWPNVSLYQATIDPQYYRLNYEVIDLEDQVKI